jgi:protein-L-isoaspartate(D-aspartate) O-methyltransferase
VLAGLGEQFTTGGRLVAPVEDDEQRLVVERRIGDVIERRTLERVRFVPLVRGR